MESLKTCSVCFVSFDAKVHAPRFLPCGHTICSNCLPSILNNPLLRKCPFDNHPFTPSQTSLTSFPINFLVLDMLEQKNNNLCKTHLGEKLKYICLTENKKICSECAKQEEHKEHKIKKIKELKAQGAKVRSELQQGLLSLKEHELEKEKEKEKDCEQIRKVFVKTIDEQFQEIKEILVEKQFTLVQQANKLFNFNKNLDSKRLLELKQEMVETIKNITQTCNEDGGDMILLDKAIHENQKEEKMRPQLLKEKSSKVQNKLLEMQNTLTSSLTNFKSGVNSLELPSQEVMKEICCGNEEEKQQLSQELRSITLQTYFDVTNHSSYLEISAKDCYLKEVEINLEDFKAHQTVVFNLERYDTLSKESHEHFLPYILRRLVNLSNLQGDFNPNSFNNDAFSWFGNTVPSHLGRIRQIYLNFTECKFNDDSMQFFCDNILSKMTNLQTCWLNFESAGIRSKDIKSLASSLQALHSTLEVFDIGFDNNESITDDGIIQLFQVIQDMRALKKLAIYLSKTKISDIALKMFGERVLPNFKALRSLTLWSDVQKVSEKGIWPILQNLPSLPSLQELNLKLFSIPLSNKLWKVFNQQVFPKLEALESFTFDVENTLRKNANLQKIQDLVKSKMQAVQICS